jgi:hypothetical protein
LIEVGEIAVSAPTVFGRTGRGVEMPFSAVHRSLLAQNDYSREPTVLHRQNSSAFDAKTGLRIA